MRISAHRQNAPAGSRSAGRAMAPPGASRVSFETTRRSAPLQALQRRADGQLLSAPAGQRQSDIQDVDYDPVNRLRLHGGIRVAQAFTRLDQLIRGDAGLTGFVGQLNNVLTATRAKNFAARDVPAAAQAVTTDLIAEFANRGLVVAGGRVTDLLEHVDTAFGANTQGGHAMDANELRGFNALKTIVGEANMSRAKGTATQIPRANLPGWVSGEVTTVRNEINAARARFANNNILHPRDLMPNRRYFNAAVHAALPHSRTAHTNNAGWLPGIPIPVDHVQRAKNNIYTGASAQRRALFNAADPLTIMGLNSGGNPTALGLWYRAEFVRQKLAINANQMRESIWGTIGAGGGQYIEFHIAGDISRLVYDWQNDRLFLPAHYKWGAGYNPFFRIT